MNIKKHINKATIIAFAGGFVVGLFWYQLTAWAQGIV